MADGKKKKSGKKTGPDWSWILFIFVITMVISAAMSFISSRLLRNANRVSSFCNDVIGDICGVISGSAAAVIAARAVLGMESTKATIVTLGMSALVAAVTVGGKAVGKTFAMGGSVQVVRTTAKVICFFRTIFQNKGRK